VLMIVVDPGGMVNRLAQRPPNAKIRVPLIVRLARANLFSDSPGLLNEMFSGRPPRPEGSGLGRRHKRSQRDHSKWIIESGHRATCRTKRDPVARRHILRLARALMGRRMRFIG